MYHKFVFPNVHYRGNRLNSPTTFEMPLEVLGHELQFSQVSFCFSSMLFYNHSVLQGKEVV